MVRRTPRKNLESGSKPWFDRQMEFGVLGPVEARLDGERLPIGGPKPRALLAMLLLRANEVVSRGRLVEGLWGDRPPASAEHGLDHYVSRLRSVLGADRIERRAPGYLLHVEPEKLDIVRFEQLLADGRARLAAGEPAAAVAGFDAALALWRGSALADVLDEPFATAEAGRLEERRELCREVRIDGMLALGGGPDLVSELELLVAEHPFRERLLGQLMVALYRSGRQADALAAYQGGRARLAADLGLEPGLPLRHLERQILEQDPALGGTAVAPVGRGAGIRRRRTPFLVGAVAVAAVAVSATVGIELLTVGTRAASAGRSASSSLVELTGGARAVAATVLPEGPAAAAVGAGSVWLAEPDTGEVMRVSERSRAILERIPVGAGPGAIAFGAGALWVASVPGGSVLRIDPTTYAVTRIDLGAGLVGALAFGLHRLWIADAADDALLVLNPRTDIVTPASQLDFQPTALAVGDGGVWVADYGGGSLTKLDSQTGETLSTTLVGGGPVQVAIGKGAVWVANSLDSTVSRVDPVTGALLSTTSVGSEPVALAATTGAVWVASKFADDVTRLDPSSPSSVRTIHVDGRPTALAAAGGHIWVGAAPAVIRRGGTVVLLSSSPFPIDPAVNLIIDPFQSDGLTRDGLVTYNHIGGPDGTQLVPDLALALPRPTEGGTVYAFQLRAGIRYSDGRPVRASDFRRGLERVFRLGSQGIPYFSRLVGAAACSRTRCDLTRGVVTDDRARTISFHLVAPDPDFLSTLTMALETPVPRGTPWRRMGWTPIPGTGPYEIASASNHAIHYVRNPYFHEWSHAAQPDGVPAKIVMRFGLGAAHEVGAIEQGRADWTYQGVPASLLPDVATRFPALVHSYLWTTTAFLQFNTTVPPFNSLSARQALNDAVDRAAVVRFYGGRLAATPTCQILPPGLFGYRRLCPYKRNPTRGNGRWQAPDLSRARELVARSGTRGDRITVWGNTDDSSNGRVLVPYVVRLLDRLGYRAQAHVIPQRAWASVTQQTYAKIQITASPFWNDTSPANFFKAWFACNAPYDHHWFCEPGFDRAIRRAETLEADDSPEAAALWARLDRELVDQAAAVPLVNPRQIDFVSARVTNYQHNPVYGLIADQLQPQQPARKSVR
jgi:peptide/nickel transport system substrate-binding protein